MPVNAIQPGCPKHCQPKWRGALRLDCMARSRCRAPLCPDASSLTALAPPREAPKSHAPPLITCSGLHILGMVTHEYILNESYVLPLGLCRSYFCRRGRCRPHGITGHPHHAVWKMVAVSFHTPAVV